MRLVPYTYVGLVCDISHDGRDNSHVHEGDARSPGSEAEVVVSGLLHSCARALGAPSGRLRLGRSRTRELLVGRIRPELCATMVSVIPVNIALSQTY